ncbi:MAG TPA: hypothetical protein VJI69_05415 [Bacteroidia bacterium]|nr:hypothetical protein [Bacteroidia bacterium]
MKKFIFLMFVMLGIATSSQAQIVKFTATVGDLEMDNLLTDIHNQAIKDITGFHNNVVNTFNIVSSKVDAALKILAPGDVYMAAQLSVSIGKPFDEVVKTYQANKAKGWGAIAKEMGIKPGSPEFHAMKKSMKDKHGKGNGNSGGAGNSNGKGNSGKGKKK